MPLLLGLLIVAYLGNLWASSPTGNYGRASGVQYMVLGALVGPGVLGMISTETVRTFHPIAFAALGWLALGFGLECGMIEERTVPLRRFALALLFAAGTTLIAGASVFATARRLGFEDGTELWIMSSAIGLLSCETTRHALRWVNAPKATPGPLSQLIADLSAADDAIVLVGLALVYAWFDRPRALMGIALPRGSGALLSLGLGAGLGLVAAALTTAMPRRVEWWAVLLGASMLCIGATTSVGMSAMGAMFAMGLSLRTASRQGSALREMFARTERTVLLPALVLAGAHLALPASVGHALIVLAAVAARALSSFVSGAALSVSRPSPRPAAGWLGLGMLSSGTLTMAVGFSVALRYEGSIGQVALAAACAGTVLGELVGPPALRQALRSCGELQAGGSEPPASIPLHGDKP